jgi:hypothetical protein
LEGIPESIGLDLDLSFNGLTSLAGILKLKKMNGCIDIRGCPVTSHILGVFFIKGCTGINSHLVSGNSIAVAIVNRHISKGRVGLLHCQKELIEAGLADFAQI